MMEVSSRVARGVIIGIVCVAGSVAQGNVDLVWRPDTLTVDPGEIVKIALFAVSDGDPTPDQPIAALDVLPSWTPQYLELLGVHMIGVEYPWQPATVAGWFPNDIGGDGMNVPLYCEPGGNDGNAKFTALARVGAGNEAWATPEGLMITTFLFLALEPTPPGDPTAVEMLPSYGNYSQTKVRKPGNYNITGELDTACITITPEPASLLLLLGGGLLCVRRR